MTAKFRLKSIGCRQIIGAHADWHSSNCFKQPARHGTFCFNNATVSILSVLLISGFCCILFYYYRQRDARGPRIKRPIRRCLSLFIIIIITTIIIVVVVAGSHGRTDGRRTITMIYRRVARAPCRAICTRRAVLAGPLSGWVAAGKISWRLFRAGQDVSTV